MEDPAPTMRLHQIQAKMPFGRTDFVPEEETRNLRANFPEPDILQPFKEAATSLIKRQESIEFSEKLTCRRDTAVEYCRDVASNSLSHPDYRKLLWLSLQGDFDDQQDTEYRAKIKKTTSPQSLYAGGKKVSAPSEVITSQLESRYRLGSSIPFCLNPHAAYLIQHATIMGQRKKVQRELGTNVIYLNDRNHFRGLEHHLNAIWERRSDIAHRTRADAEYEKVQKVYREDLSDILKPKKHKKQAAKDKSIELLPEFDISVIEEPAVAVAIEEEKREGTPFSTSGESNSHEVTEDHETLENSKELTPPKAPSADSLPPLPSAGSASSLSSRVSMRGLYDNAEKSVKFQEEFQPRRLKYYELPWPGSVKD
ncbi:unnamed protein product [Calicophoron daubneyi]|uniref:Uncharacterized protein n=1 Tax=Calicophoron daubneyi TaxID=300641 RepID=A0AAV2TGF1_CALDB